MLDVDDLIWNQWLYSFNCEAECMSHFVWKHSEMSKVLVLGYVSVSEESFHLSHVEATQVGPSHYHWIDAGDERRGR